MKLSDFVLRRRRGIDTSMRTVMVLNPKGGSGKTTVATNLAGYLAAQGAPVTLADFDPQASALAWLAARPRESAPITGLAAFREPLWVPAETEFVVMDVPAGVDVLALRRLVARAGTVIVPVLPSPIDMRAAATFLRRVQELPSVTEGRSKVALVANRVRAQTGSAQALDGFLREIGLPLIAHLRDSQQYVHAAERGAAIFELAPSAVANEVEDWQPLLRWLKGRRSQPETDGELAFGR